MTGERREEGGEDDPEKLAIEVKHDMSKVKGAPQAGEHDPERWEIRDERRHARSQREHVHL